LFARNFRLDPPSAQQCPIIRGLGESFLNNLVRDGRFHTTEEIIWHFTRVIQGLPRLRKFIFVLGGRDDGFEGPYELMEPTSDFEDYYSKDGRVNYIEQVSELAEVLRVKLLTISSCAID